MAASGVSMTSSVSSTLSFSYHGGSHAHLLMAQLSWTPSNDPDLVEYEVRMTPAATYDSNNASVIGNLTPGFEQFETMEGLANPGDVPSYKVYVLLSTGNEAGSNTVTITRP